MIETIFDNLWGIAFFGWFCLGIREAIRFAVLCFNIILALVAGFTGEGIR